MLFTLVLEAFLLIVVNYVDTSITKLEDHGGEDKNVDHNEKTNNSTSSNDQTNNFVYFVGNPIAAWPLGIIPYDLDPLSYDTIVASRVRESMNVLEAVSCLQFRALSGMSPGRRSWIHITNPEGKRECSHEPTRKKTGEIVLSLGWDCLRQRDILHALLHAIGFSDEVTHPHRDQYVRVMWQNIQPMHRELFGIKMRPQKLLVDYDPMSIMHFHDRAYSINGQATIALLMPGLQIQPSERLSQLDKMKLRIAFSQECNRRSVDEFRNTCKNVMYHENFKTADNGNNSEENGRMSTPTDQLVGISNNQTDESETDAQ